MADSDREKWDARYGRGEHPGIEPPAWLEAVEAEIPRRGRAVDLAAGAGRVALWLARRGLDTTAVDVSGVGLDLARRAAAEEGLALRTLERDLEETGPPDGPWDVASVFHYRQPGLLRTLGDRLARDGVLVAELPTVRNLERHARPSARFLAEPNELVREASALTIVWYREGWVDDRHLARLVARARSEVP